MTTTARVRRRNRTRAVVWALAAAVLVVVAAVAWVGVRGVLAKGEFDKIVPLTGEMRAAAADGDLDALAAVSDDLADHADRAASLTGDPIWRAAEIVPWVGDDLAAVRISAAQLSAVATSAIKPLLAIAADFTGGSSPDGSAVDLTAVQRAAGPLTAAATTLSAARDQLSQIDRPALIPQLRDGVNTLASTVGDGAETVTSLAGAASILPGMLGADEPRSLLVMLQNNAELRTGGGITGSFAQLDADNGRLSLVAQADSSEFESLARPILPVPDALTALYGHVVGRFVQNTSIPADFTLSADLASAWWQQRTGVIPDAVISIDPLVLRSLLKVAGPVTLADGTELNADNLVERLLVDPYRDLDQRTQSVFQQQVTAAVFDGLLSGSIDPLVWARGLSQPIAEGRVSVWSAHPDEQRLITESPVAGPLARHLAAGPDAFAVYFNDTTGAKMDVFLKSAITTGVASCRDDGRRDVAVTVALTSVAPADAAAYPPSVTGGANFGTAAGDVTTAVTVAAPPGTFLDGVTQDGEDATTTSSQLDGFAATVASVTLVPGASSALEFRFTAAQSGPVNPIIVHTPMLDEPAIGTDVLACR